MLAVEKILEIERLLAAGGLSQRKIAAALGCSRATVSAVARGTRPAYLPRRRRLEPDEPKPLGIIGRCPTCGARVYMPCRLCRVRKIKAAEERILQALRRRAQQESRDRLLSAVRQANETSAPAS